VPRVCSQAVSTHKWRKAHPEKNRAILRRQNVNLENLTLDWQNQDLPVGTTGCT
jgi:hypothetical protein